MRLAEGNHLFEEIEDIPIRLESVPVQPADLVILVVRIVVSELGVQELVTGPEHGDAVRSEKAGSKNSSPVSGEAPGPPQARSGRPRGRSSNCNFHSYHPHCYD